MVHLTVKTIKGKKFQIDVEPTQTVLEVKRVIEATNAEFPAAQLKLIHSGKILKDESTLEEYKIKENEFLVCMVTKPKPAPAAAPPAPAAATPATPAVAASAPAAATPAAAPPAAAPAAPAPAAADVSLNEDHIRQLTDMGFVEDQARAALRAAIGNPGLAVEFLTAGIPDDFQGSVQPNASLNAPAAAGAPSESTPAPGRAMETLDDFRGHPQFNQLKRLVQRDPSMLTNVLQMIGQQSPNLLARIHENQQQFIELMNEPVDESASPMGSGASPGNPAQMAQMLQALTPTQRAHMAAAMGLSPQQLAQVSEVIGNMPPENFQQLMGAVRGVPPGSGRNVIHLTEEEGAAVARLAELGFDRTDAAQAYLACDKNEALAANLLMDGMGAGLPPSFSGAPVGVPAATPTPTPTATPAAPESRVPTTNSSSAESAEPPASSNPSSSGQTPNTDESSSSRGDQSSGGSGEDEDEDEDMYG